MNGKGSGEKGRMHQEGSFFFLRTRYGNGGWAVWIWTPELGPGEGHVTYIGEEKGFFV